MSCVEYELSESCDYCGKSYGGSIIEAQGPCVRCIGEHGPEVNDA